MFWFNVSKVGFITDKIGLRSCVTKPLCPTGMTTRCEGVNIDRFPS